MLEKILKYPDIYNRFISTHVLLSCISYMVQQNFYSHNVYLANFWAVMNGKLMVRWGANHGKLCQIDWGPGKGGTPIDELYRYVPL